MFKKIFDRMDSASGKRKRGTEIQVRRFDMTEAEKAQRRIKSLKAQIKGIKTKLAKANRRSQYQLICMVGDEMPEDLAEEFDYEFEVHRGG
jgi:hypothetical protein